MIIYVDRYHDPLPLPRQVKFRSPTLFEKPRKAYCSEHMNTLILAPQRELVGANTHACQNKLDDPKIIVSSILYRRPITDLWCEKMRSKKSL